MKLNIYCPRKCGKDFEVKQFKSSVEGKVNAFKCPDCSEVYYRKLTLDRETLEISISVKTPENDRIHMHNMLAFVECNDKEVDWERVSDEDVEKITKHYQAILTTITLNLGKQLNG